MPTDQQNMPPHHRQKERVTEAVRRTEGLVCPHETSPHEPGALLCRARRRHQQAAAAQAPSVAAGLRKGGGAQHSTQNKKTERAPRLAQRKEAGGALAEVPESEEDRERSEANEEPTNDDNGTPSAPAPMAEEPMPKRICKFFQEGACRFGDEVRVFSNDV